MYIALFFATIAIFLYISYKLPSAALGALLCSFAMEQWFQSKDAFFLINGSLINIVIGLLVLVSVVFKLIKDGNVFKNYPINAVLIIMLFIYAGISVMWSPVADISYQNYIHYLPYLALSIIVAPLLIKNDSDFYYTSLFLVFVGGILAVLILFFAEWGYRRIQMPSLVIDARANPLAIANMAGYVLFSAILINFKRELAIWKVARWALVVVCLGIAVKTGSRGQFMLMILLSLMFLPISRPINHIKRFIPLVVAIAFISYISLWALNQYTSDYTEKESARWDADRMEQDISGRFDAANVLIAKWYSSPENLLFGLGSSASYDPDIFGFYTHIVPLEILGELGLVGFLLFLLILYNTYKIFWRSFKNSKGSSTRRGVLATVSAITLFEFLLSFKQGSLLGNQLMFCMFLVLAKIDKSFEVPVDKQASRPPKTENNAINEIKPETYSGVRLR